MTLFRQIALMLSSLLLIILVTVLVLNFSSANNSVKERLYNDAKNTATSLSLSLATAQGDESIMSTMINASFDSGYYSYILLEDIEKNIIYKRVLEQKSIDVPDWFIKSVNIKAPVAQASVSAGWSQVGILYVQGDAGYAYTQLYTIFKNLIISFGVIAVLGLIALNFIVAMILKPLRRVQQQAEAVTRNEFIIQGDIPNTQEFKEVVLGMNSMVKKVKAMFDKGNEELKRLKEQEYIDSGTKLRNNKYFIDKLPEFLKIDATSNGGANISISLSGIIEANDKIGHERVDELFVKLSDIFKISAQEFSNAIALRMNGTEFCVFIPDATQDIAIEVANKIKSQTSSLINHYSLDNDITYISIGIYGYHHKENIEQFLSNSADTLVKARKSDEHIYVKFSSSDADSINLKQWRDIIELAIASNNVSLIPYKVVNSNSKKVVHLALSLSIKNDEDVSYSYGQFMAPANQVGLANKIYDNVLAMIINNRNESLRGSICSLRLSSEYLALEESYKYVEKLLKESSNIMAYKMIIEIPDKFAYTNYENANRYKNLFERHNIDMGLYEFIGESGDYRYLQELRPVYLKAEGSYFISQTDQGLSALKLITDSVGISLIASSVMESETVDRLKDKEISIIQGRASELL